MANAFKGEKDIGLAGIVDPMIGDISVVSEWKSDEGFSLYREAVKAVNGMIKTRQLECALDRAEIMTEKVGEVSAAWLFYLAAKKANSQVEFGEIQEAVYLEGAIDGVKAGYPLLFALLCEFAIVGSLKKKSVETQS